MYIRRVVVVRRYHIFLKKIRFGREGVFEGEMEGVQVRGEGRGGEGRGGSFNS